ncbi:MAG: hypothetical protein DCC55_35910 [Chloroflexi bacterium]|nr:MAG: hypothetical protein DCC55_35910 [Chloroflexota bacterium]
MTQRDNRGRFTTGNTISKRGWAGLVRKRFKGSEATARAYVAQLGRYAYASMFDPRARTPMMQWRFENFFAHPGTPEQFARQFDFTLDDLREVRP